MSSSGVQALSGTCGRGSLLVSCGRLDFDVLAISPVLPNRPDCQDILGGADAELDVRALEDAASLPEPRLTAVEV
jgi:hypothetical protein